MEEQDEDIELSRGKRIVITLSALVFFVLFFATAVAILAEPGGTYSMRARGGHARILLTREQGLAVMVPLLALSAVSVVALFWRSLRHSWRMAQSGTVASELNPGETVLWFGKAGWRSFSGGRVAGMVLVIALPLLSAWWIWSIAAGSGVLSIKLFWMMFPVAFLFCYVVPAIVYGSDAMKTWMWEMFGSIAITRARIVWLTPVKRRIYRTIPADEIVDVCVTDSDGKHGSLTVIKRLGSDVEYVYLDGLGEPERALAAVQSLITYRSPSGVQR